MFYADGTDKLIIKNYPMKDCDKNSFTDSEFQKEYSDFLFNRGPVKIRQCVDDPNNEIYLQGNRDSNVYKRNNTWIYLQIDKVDADACDKGSDSDCSKKIYKETIEEYISNKNTLPLVLNKAPNFGSFDTAFKEVEMFQQSVKLGPNVFTDTGYRFRINRYTRQDVWYFPSTVTDTFTDLTKFNHDEYNILPTVYKKMIGQLWFRLESNLLTHTRTVIQIEDFFGRIGGIFGILIYIFEVSFGDYINFEAKIRWIQKFYRFEKPKG